MKARHFKGVSQGRPSKAVREQIRRLDRKVEKLLESRDTSKLYRPRSKAQLAKAQKIAHGHADTRLPFAVVPSPVQGRGKVRVGNDVITVRVGRQVAATTGSRASDLRDAAAPARRIDRALTASEREAVMYRIRLHHPKVGVSSYVGGAPSSAHAFAYDAESLAAQLAYFRESYGDLWDAVFAGIEAVSDDGEGEEYEE